jgi:hypothetical protein
MNKQLTDVLNSFFSAKLSGVHTAMPGRIETYNAAEKRVTVKPLINRRFRLLNGQKGYPVLVGVPVVFPGTAETVIQFPLKRGDKCMLVFSERALDEWLAGSGAESSPADPRQFALADAVCLPGLFTFKAPGKVGQGDGLEFWHKGQRIAVKDDGNIEIGSAGLALSARQGDATNIDLVTDPSNMSLIVAGLAMLGMTVTPPLVGKITGGSSNVKVGS